jgi:hypothetical protein
MCTAITTRIRKGLTAREEEILSYMTGLGPVGTVIDVHREMLYLDLGINHPNPNTRRVVAHRHIASLIEGKWIRLVASGWRKSAYIVLRRLEDCPLDLPQGAKSREHRSTPSRHYRTSWEY